MRSFCFLEAVGAAIAGAATVVAPSPAMAKAATGMTSALRKTVPWSDVPSRGPYCAAVRGAVNEIRFRSSPHRRFLRRISSTLACRERRAQPTVMKPTFTIRMSWVTFRAESVQKADKSPRKPRWRFVLGGPYSQAYDPRDRGRGPRQGLPLARREVRALDGVDLTGAARARCSGLLGPNGAGKTTTVRILATLLRAGRRPATRRRLRRRHARPRSCGA